MTAHDWPRDVMGNIKPGTLARHKSGAELVCGFGERWSLRGDVEPLLIAPKIGDLTPVAS